MKLSAQQRDFLEAVHFAVVATIGPDGMPHQTVMWYMLDGERVLLNTPKNSRKHRHLQQDPRLSVCIEDTYRYVTLQGRVSLDEDPERARADYSRLGERYRGTFSARPAPAASGSGDRPPQRPSFLSRERVSLWLEVDHWMANSLG